MIFRARGSIGFVAICFALHGWTSALASESEIPSAVVAGVERALSPISSDSLRMTRESLIRYVWKGVDPYKLKPASVVARDRTGNMVRVVPDADVKTIGVEFTNGLRGFIEYAANASSRCLAIWAQGHEGTPPMPAILPGAVTYLKKRWESGCDIIVVPMPFRPEGAIEIRSEKEGLIYVPRPIHDAAALIDTAEFSAFRLFLDPLFAGLNWLEQAGRSYDKVTMAGVSGGGWMSVVYPAIDTRVRESISVAGSFPMFLRYYPTNGAFRDIGDWEQNFAPFYQIASYYDLYLLSALGAGRSQTLVYNVVDPCCFSGDRAKLFLPQLERKAKELGVNLTGIIDASSDQHDISENVILRLFAR